MFDPAVDAKLVAKGGSDVLVSSAINYYGRGLTQKDVSAFYAGRQAPNDPEPVSLGLNSTLEKSGAGLVERVWKIGGRYTEALEQVVHWLEKASAVAESEPQRVALDKLVRFYSERGTARLGRVQHRVGRGQRLARRRDQRFHRGLSRPARHAWIVRVRRRVPRSRCDSANRGDRVGSAVVRRSVADLRAAQEDRRQRHHGQGDHGRDRVRRLRARDADRHQPAECRLDPHAARLEVGEPRQHRCGVRRGARRRRPRVRLGRGRCRTRRALLRARVRAAHRHARGDRARVRPDRARRRDSVRDTEELRLDDRGSARRSRRALLRDRPEARRARPHAVDRSGTSAIRALHPQRVAATALPRAAGRRRRRRSHAQPAAGCCLVLRARQAPTK